MADGRPPQSPRGPPNPPQVAGAGHVAGQFCPVRCPFGLVADLLRVYHGRHLRVTKARCVLISAVRPKPQSAMGSVNFAPAFTASGIGEGMLRSGNTEFEIFEVSGEHDRRDRAPDI